MRVPAPPKKFTSYCELFLTAFIIVIFVLSALQSGSFAFAHREEWQGAPFIVASIVSMGVSGLGLMFLLMLKLGKLERMDAEKKQILGMMSARVAAIEAASDGIGIVDKEGNLVYLNKSLMKLHGIAPEEIDAYLGRSWENLYTEKGKEQIKKDVLPILYSKGYWQGESPVAKKDGTLVYAAMSLTVLEGGGFIGTARDITDRRKAELEKEELQTQFFHAQKMEAVGRLAGGIAHDFNNILASMLGYTEFLLEDLPQDTRERHFVNQILNGALQAQKLVEQILTFSRRNEAACEMMNLVSAVTEAGAMLESAIPPNIRLRVVTRADQAFIMGNAAQIGQILMNLCVNAVDAIDAKEGEIVLDMSLPECGDGECLSLSSEKGEQNDYAMNITEGEDGNITLQLGKFRRGVKYVRLRVSDTGCGMNREIMEHMFEPFFTTKSPDKGTGLGLSSVHGIIAAHDGVLVVNSRAGKGTAFILHFPLAEEVAPPNEVEDRKSSGERPGGQILLVEDEEPVRAMMIQMLGRLGYECHACADGAEAVDHMREKKGSYDLIISDYTMPHMNGAEMAGEIGIDFPQVPIILLSGYSKRRLNVMAAENRNIKSVLKKPVRREILEKEIAAILSGNIRKAG